MAQRDGLAVAWGKGVRRLDCEVDNLDLVKAVNDVDLGRFVPELFQNQGMLRWQWKVSVRGIHRDCNRVADFLVKTTGGVSGLIVLEAPCLELQVLLLRDGVG